MTGGALSTRLRQHALRRQLTSTCAVRRLADVFLQRSASTPASSCASPGLCRHGCGRTYLEARLTHGAAATQLPPVRLPRQQRVCAGAWPGPVISLALTLGVGVQPAALVLCAACKIIAVSRVCTRPGVQLRGAGSFVGRNRVPEGRKLLGMFGHARLHAEKQPRAVRALLGFAGADVAGERWTGPSVGFSPAQRAERSTCDKGLPAAARLEVGHAGAVQRLRHLRVQCRLLPAGLDRRERVAQGAPQQLSALRNVTVGPWPSRDVRAHLPDKQVRWKAVSLL